MVAGRITEQGLEIIRQNTTALQNAANVTDQISEGIKEINCRLEKLEVFNNTIDKDFDGLAIEARAMFLQIKEIHEKVVNWNMLKDLTKLYIWIIVFLGLLVILFAGLRGLEIVKGLFPALGG